LGKLYFVGLGLSAKHLTLQALEALSKADVIFLEAYTSLPEPGLEESLRKMLPLAELRRVGRKELEDEGARCVFEELEKGKTVALAVVGDPFIATTHAAIKLEAAKRGHAVAYVPGVSVLQYAISASGLFAYKFGASATVVYPKWGIVSVTPYKVLEANRSRGLHTFFFLDIDEELGPMTPSTALELLFEAQRLCGGSALSPSDGVLVLERLGFEGERLYFCEASAVAEARWGSPPYSIIVPGLLHPVEKESLEVVGCRLPKEA